MFLLFCIFGHMLQVSELFIYPIKSLPGVSVKEAIVTDRGFEHDRRWMLVDENGLFISQREASEMTQLRVSIGTNGLHVTHRSKPGGLHIPIGEPASGSPGMVTVWDDTCPATYVSKTADDWFSSMLGINCRLVYMTDDSRRLVDQAYARGNHITSFSDAYPFLLLGQASLDDLNSRMDTKLPIDRFRPNIVFTGGCAFEEDLMDHVRINNIDFNGVKLCARCRIPTINQQTGTKGKEPLKTLAKFRLRNNKVYFGQNLVHSGEGIVRVGDTLDVLSLHTDERFLIGAQDEKIL